MTVFCAVPDYTKPQGGQMLTIGMDTHLCALPLGRIAIVPALSGVHFLIGGIQVSNYLNVII